MKKLILVPLNRNDRAEDLMPYVEEVARAGMKAVFLVPYPVDGFRWSHEQCGRKAIEEGDTAGALLQLGHPLAKSRRADRPRSESLVCQGHRSGGGTLRREYETCNPRVRGEGRCASDREPRGYRAKDCRAAHWQQLTVRPVQATEL